ncbi:MULTISPECIES: hypothetical protein [Aquimarina]|uniref:Uncharacterized protein n=1 Tax=Aquimarina algiphila TaxID=2047982 RepID=A0A554VCG3_9FLAO|nr:MULTISPECIES: hypothetical protein [Aquimarina]TSE04395.1 hypothetical protein FOF46_26580 [Aquimarina algiphila]
MKITCYQRLTHFYVILLLVCISCTKEHHEKTHASIDSLESLKAAFDEDRITHLHYRTSKQSNILNDEIMTMKLIYDEVGELYYLQLTSQSAEGELHHAKLTLDKTVQGSIAEDMLFAPWVNTIISIDGKKHHGLHPYSMLFESGISSSGLHILSDSLRIDFH